MAARLVHHDPGGTPGHHVGDPVDRRACRLEVRLAHVLRRQRLSPAGLLLVLAAIAAWKAVEVAALHRVEVALPFALAATVIIVRPRLGATLLALVALAIVLAPTSATGQPAVNHLTWVFWVAAAVALLDGTQRDLALRSQLCILYAFSATAKVWPDFLDGSTLATETWIGSHAPLWVLVAAAWATLVVEATLAVAVWARGRWWWAGLSLAVGLHLSFLLLTVTDPWRIGRLVIFGGLAVAVWLRIGPRPQAATA